MSLLSRGSSACIPAFTRATIRQRCNVANLLQLPAETRTSLYRSRIAHFHASAVRHDAVTPVSQSIGFEEQALYGLLEGLHTTSGLSWAYAIPLSAFLIRGIFWPWQVADRKGQQRYLDLQPLLNAWKIKLYNRLYFEHAATRDADWLKRSHMMKMRQERNNLLKRWNAGWFSRSGLLTVQIPVFVLVAGIYRRMCGLEQGFLSAMISKVPILGRATGEDGAGSLIVPSFANEGMLWFPDLTAADPTGNLAMIVAGLNMAMIGLNAVRSRRNGAPHLPMTTRQRGFLVGGLGLCVLIVPWTSGMPAGVMLYWASSTAATMVSNLAMDIRHPLQTAPTPCKKRAKVSFEAHKMFSKD